MPELPSEDEQRSNEQNSDQSSAASLEEAVGIEIPDEHVGAFVAEVFEDAERATTWTDIVDSMVAPEARDAWEALAPVEQAVEVLEMADSYDERAADLLAGIEVDSDDPDESTIAAFEEATRLRNNADAFRDGIAAAYDEGHIDDDELVEAVESFGFDTDTIARREDELERVTSVYELDYRPYGGTLIQESEAPAADPDIPETF
jgi:hypothetical protein